MSPGPILMDPGGDDTSPSQTGQGGLRFDRSLGNVGVLPDSSDIPDPDSLLMAPVADLSAVAAAGRQVGSTYLSMLENPEGGAAAFPYLATMLGVNVGHAGQFDYQRRGNRISETDWWHSPKVSVFVSLPGGSKRTRIFQYSRGHDPGPVITPLDAHTIQISLQRVNSITCRNEKWGKLIIEYDIGSIKYPGLHDPPPQCER